MRKLVYFVAGTIDGFIAAPDGSWEWMGVTEDVVRFMVESYPETVPTHARGPLGVPDAPNPRFDTVVMGRRTYDPALAEGITSPYSHLRQIVFSHTLKESKDVEIVADDPQDFVAKLKQEPGRDIWLAGGGEFAGQLLPLVDELVVKLNPIVAGDGIPLVRAGFDPHRFTLLDAKPLPSGVVVLHYSARPGA
ncbi:dihydrofolate reductase family protein [Actinoplanes sp. NPDC023714]|uniref:dihydrofolate reductase family protein n=1 Tax=Actinoplanes sp. NPDC023714 TaxID=3154322 RepID=UPI0033FD6B00